MIMMLPDIAMPDTLNDKSLFLTQEKSDLAFQLKQAQTLTE